MVEGSLKSLITALKLWFRHGRKDIQIIGAAGANWLASVNAVINGLGQASKVVLCPDAGSLSNSGILSNYKKIIEELTSKVYSVSVAWWNQITKNECDIDELNDYSQIKFISINEFLSIAQNQQIGEQKTQQIQVNSSSDWREEYELKRSDRAKIKFTRKPDVEVKDGYLPIHNLKALPEGIIGLKGDWGIGKSYFTANLCKQWSGNILQIAHLNAILHNTAPKYDLMHHHEVKKLNLSLTSVPKLSICDVTFAANFNPESWVKGEPFILILDEITQGLKSLHTSPNLRGNLRIKARTKLEWLIKNATYIIAADRDLDNETLEYIERVRDDGKKSFIIHHTGKKGKFHKPITINNNKYKDEVITKLINDAKAGLKCAIACENKADLIAIELLLKDTGIPEESIFLAHGDNSNEHHIKPIIQAIDSQYTEYPILGYTMTMGTAISLEKQHFDRVYAFFTGDVLAASDQCQMLFRYRPDCEIIIWVSPRRRTLEIDPKNLLKNLQINVDETDNLISSIDTLHKKGIMPTAKGVITEDELPFLQHKLNIISRINASKANPFQSLHDLLIDAGFIINLECTDTEEATRTGEGEIHVGKKKAVKEESDRLIAQAELMNDVEFESARINAGSLRKSERDRLQKTQLHRDTNLEISQDIVKLQRTKNLTRGARKLKVLLGDDDTAVAYDLADRERNPDKGDQSFYAANRRLLCDIGTPELIAKLLDGWSYTNDSPEIQEFADEMRRRKANVKRLLGFTVSMERNSKGNFKISNTQLFNQVLDSLCVLRTSSKQSKDKDSKRSNVYALDKEHWELLQKIMAHMDSQPHTPDLQSIIKKAKDSVTSIDMTSAVEMSETVSTQEWLTDENIQDTALILESCDSAEMLQDVRISIPAFVLKSAAKLLPVDKQKLVKNWVIELNQQCELVA